MRLIDITISEDHVRYTVVYKKLRKITDSLGTRKKNVYVNHYKHNDEYSKQWYWEATVYIPTNIPINREIYSGMGEDNDMTVFGDFFSTLQRARKLLTDPVTIISSHVTREYSQINNHIKEIAVKYDPEDESDVYNLKPTVKKMVVNEYDYIMSRDWVKEWLIDDKIDVEGWNYKLLITDGKNAVITGGLTLC